MSTRWPIRLALAMRFFSAAFAILAAAAASRADDVNFLRDVRPILINRCYRCHSSLKQEGGLRLDQPETLAKGGERGPAFISGQAAQSLLVLAIRREGELKMPPEGDPLSPQEIGAIERWINAGAKLPTAEELKHWSFVPPRRAVPPAVQRPDWPLTAVDSWIAARLDAARIAPSAPATKPILLRRLKLDLLGVPPSDDELAEFVADEGPDALERVTDRWLAHPGHGQRWGRHWMDVWRYSDWDGYGAEVRESQPHIWRWRDWIIEAVNADKPYQRMIVEMLAGDELAPDDPATTRATGFLVRNWFKFNRNVWLDNTVEHTGKAFLGLTFNCARCHDHMYDPMTQREYYQLRACFEPYDVRTDPLPGQLDPAKDGVVRAYDAKLDTPTFVFTRGDEKQPEKEQPVDFGLPKALAAQPVVIRPVALGPASYYPGSQSFVQDQALADARGELTKAETSVTEAQAKLAAAQTKLTNFVAASRNPTPSPAPAANNPEIFSDDFAQSPGKAWTFDSGKWEQAEGRLRQLEPLSAMCSAIAPATLPKDFLLKTRFRTTGGNVYKSVGVALDRTSDKDLQFVYLSAYAQGPKLQYAYRRGGQDHYPPEAARTLPVELDREYELTLAVRNQTLNILIDGQPQLAVRLAVERTPEGRVALWTYDATADFLRVQITALPADFAIIEPPAGAAASLPAAEGPASEASLQAEVAAAQASVADATAGIGVARANLEAVERRIAADRAQYSPTPAEHAKELALAAGAAERRLALRRAERAVLQAQHKLAAARAALKPNDEKSQKGVTDAEAAVAAQEKARVDAEKLLEQPHENYSRFGPVYSATSSGRRLALAEWIAANDNPLTPRVAVNHVWLRHFGSPLVASVFDFGANGKEATHPELLDSLARDFVDQGWELKRLHRLLVTSAVYRQSSSVGPEHSVAVQADPENRWWWRMNVRRMEAEQVRDATLFVAGQLDERHAGPDLDPALGMSNPRRSVYFRSSKEKRMTFLALFDGPNVSECYRRSESVAPQQALALANSALSVAQSRLLAGQLVAQLAESPAAGNPAAGNAPGASDALDERFVQAAFPRILSRPATPAEQAECLRFLREQSARFAARQSLTPFGGASDVAVKPADDPRQRARENLIHVLFNHNDFVAIR